MKIILFSFVLLFTFSARAQTTEDSVKAAINLLFEGMKSSDPAIILSSFADSAMLQTITTGADGKATVRSEKISEFAKSIGGRAKGSLDERIVFDMIRIDGDLASVWTPYEFWLNGKKNHCGVNSFQVVRLNGKWVIQFIIDTRRKC